MAKIYIMNGSPRKNGNTIKMCQEFKKGAESKGAEVEIINLYDLKYTGCRSCFACKRLNSQSFKKCVFPDDLKPLLEKIYEADGIVFASPIYFGSVTGQMQCFCERLFFPFYTYNKEMKGFPPKRIDASVLYTMNVPQELFDSMYKNPASSLMNFENWINMSYNLSERICAFDTLQFSDYSKYASEIFDENHKKQHQTEQFPKDLQNAYNAGIKMAEKIK